MKQKQRTHNEATAQGQGQASVSVSVIPYNIMIKAFADSGQLDQALSLLDEAVDRKLSLTDYSFCDLLVACGKRGDMEAGSRVHLLALTHKVERGVQFMTALMDMYARCQQLTHAEAIWEDMQRSGIGLSVSRHDRGRMPLTVVSYNAMIGALARAGKLEEAIQLLEDGTAQGLVWSARTFSPLLVACGDAAVLEAGERVHKIAMTHNATQHIIYQNALLYMLARCMAFDQARELLDNLKREGRADAVSYNTLLKGYMAARMSDAAFALFDEMKRDGIAPTDVTYTLLLSCCAHTPNAVQRAEEVMRWMRAQGLEPDAYQYGTFLDVLARAGRLHEAQQLLSAKLSNDPIAFKTLLAACRKQHDTERARRLTARMQKLPNLSEEDFVVGNLLLAHTLEHAHDGQRGAVDISAARRAMFDAGLDALNGQITFMLHGKVQYISAGESDPERLRLAKLLRERCERLIKELKLTPPKEVLSDKKGGCVHSEGIALAVLDRFLEPWAPIRMTKSNNLNTCATCRFNCLVAAMVTKRHVWLLDAEGWHHWLPTPSPAQLHDV